MVALFGIGDSHMTDSTCSGKPLELIITSFGYKKSAPPSANIVFDVRFLQNPYWVEELRPLSGKDQPVQDYVLKQELAQDFLAFLTTMLKKILPHMAERKHGEVHDSPWLHRRTAPLGDLSRGARKRLDQTFSRI